MRNFIFAAILLAPLFINAQSIVGHWTYSTISADFYADSTYGVRLGTTLADSGTYHMAGGYIDFITSNGVGCIPGDSGHYTIIFNNPDNVTLIPESDECSLRGSTLSSVTFTRETTSVYESGNNVSWSFEFNANLNLLIINTTGRFTNLSVMDIAGNSVFSTDADFSGKTSVQIPALPAGLYIIRISNSRNALAKKWMKQS